MHYANVMDASIKYSKAYYLVEKTSLTFEQIANYCDISALEVKNSRWIEHYVQIWF